MSYNNLSSLSRPDGPIVLNILLIFLEFSFPIYNPSITDLSSTTTEAFEIADSVSNCSLSIFLKSFVSKFSFFCLITQSKLNSDKIILLFLAQLYINFLNMDN